MAGKITARARMIITRLTRGRVIFMSTQHRGLRVRLTHHLPELSPMSSA